ncbi:MAG: stalk domain-containing protein [Gudongella sp.]|nr:stalk domain-containing protein [Gudongella sp.]
MYKTISKKSIIIVILFLLMFVGAQTVFAETLNNSISITAPEENQNITGGKTFNVEYDIDFFGLGTSLYFSNNNGQDWELIDELVDSENTYAWSVPNISTSDGLLKITVKSLKGSPIPQLITYYNESEKFKISKMFIMEPIIPIYPIIPIEPITPVFPIDPGLIIVKPSPPEDLTAEAISSSKIEIKWVDKSSNELGFRIERMTGTETFTEIAGVAKNTTIFIDNNLEPDTNYFYRVLAYNTMGESTFSNTASAKTESIETEEEEEEEEETVAPIIMKFYIDSSDYFVDDQIMTMDTAPVISENRTVLPIRYVVEPLGGVVDWDPIDRRVDISMGGKVINLWIGNSIASVNGNMVYIDPENTNVKPIIVPPGRTMLPLRFIAESLGAEVKWNAEIKEVTITYPAP